MKAGHAAAAAFVAAALTLGGCASVPAGDAASAAGVPSVMRTSNPKDPFESWNRKVYAFNESVDEAVLKPVATVYNRYVPSFVRTTIGNFFGNFGDVWSAVNQVLQGKFQNGLEMGMRVGVNTVLGLGGLLDIATEAGLERKEEDFGQTLGVWGVPAGPYLVLPILGPSSMRETAALPLDRGWSPALVVHDTAAQVSMTSVNLVDTRARLLNASRLLDDVALDKYVFTRDAYLTRRRSLVYDGDPPPQADDDAVDDKASDPQAPDAKAAEKAQDKVQDKSRDKTPAQPSAAEAPAAAASAVPEKK